MDKNYSPYRWAMMLLLWLGTSAQGLTYMNTPPMELPLSHEMGLSAVQVAVWVNIAFVMSIGLSIPAGLLADRVQMKRYAGAGLLLLGSLGMLRGFTNTFPTLMVASALSAVGWVIFFTSLPRVIKTWFPPGEVGAAMGVVFAGYGVGSAAGIALAQPLFGRDWRRCFAELGIWGIVAAVAWWIGAKKSPPIRSGPFQGNRPKILDGLCEVMKVKTLWLLVLIFFFYMGGRTVWLTFSFPYLVSIHAMPESLTGFVLLLDWGGYIAGSFTIALLSDRIGLRRPFFVAFGAALGTLFFLFPHISSPHAAAVYALAVGASFGAINPMIFVVCAESEDIGPERTGSATGVLISFANVGALALPVAAGRILGSLDTATMADYRRIWLLAGVALAMIALLSFPLKETGAGRTSPLMD